MLTTLILTFGLAFSARAHDAAVSADRSYVAHLRAGRALQQLRQRLRDHHVAFKTEHLGVAYDLLFARTLFAAERATSLIPSPELIWVPGVPVETLRHVADVLAKDPQNVLHASLESDLSPWSPSFEIVIIDGLGGLYAREPGAWDRLQHHLDTYLRGDALVIVVDDGDLYDALPANLQDRITTVLNGSEALRLSACEEDLVRAPKPDESRAH